MLTLSGLSTPFHFSFHFFIFPRTVWICLGLFSKHSAYARVCVRAFRKQRHYNPRALVFFQPQYLGQQTEKWCKTYLEASSHAKGVLLQTSQVWSHQGWSFKTLQTGCNKIATVNTTLTILPFLRWIISYTSSEGSLISIPSPRSRSPGA